MTIEEFVALPYSKQLTKCVLKYLQVANEVAFSNGKPTAYFFRCRSYLMKLERQSIKNIYYMLDESPKKMPMYMLEDESKEFVRKKQLEESQKTAEKYKDYEIDVGKFLGD